MTVERIHVAYLALGSNLGHRAAHLRGALERLTTTDDIRVVRTSRFYETQPVGGPTGQGPYLNAVVAIETALSPERLLDACQGLEAQAGRVRGEHWGPRTLDIDVLLYGDKAVDSPRLTIPHPRMHERRFVLEPLCEIAPELAHPVLRLSVRELLARVR